MRVENEVIERFGGLKALESRVAAYAVAIDAHRSTTDEPAPVEDSLVEQIARNGGSIEPFDPPGGIPGPDAVTELRAAINSLKSDIARSKALEAAVIGKTSVTKADIDAQVEVVADEPGAIIRK